ncbi:MAG: PaaI family thioesterase [Nannocystaceae bacterium]|nr:PaaI family thioesterase [Nannocystaceae bacterium]
MEVKTHHTIDAGLCGRPTELSPGHATVELTCTEIMRADARGLVHGGFVFGVADYAAMLAVNEPTVVLGHADVKFLAPVTTGQALVASAEVTHVDGVKRRVRVRARSGGKLVFMGEFLCIVPSHHILDPKPAKATDSEGGSA